MSGWIAADSLDMDAKSKDAKAKGVPAGVTSKSAVLVG
jgi:hypothetical protein